MKGQPMFRSRYSPVAVTLMLSVVAPAFGQVQFGDAASKTKAAAPETSGRFTMPNSNDVNVLAQFLAETLEYEPKSAEDAKEYQDQAPIAMTLAAQRIIELEDNQQSEHFLLAQKYLLAVDVMSVQEATAEEKRELLSMVLENLKSPRMDADDVDIAVALAEGLEQSGDIETARLSYEEFAKALRQHKDPLVAEVAQLMTGSATRLGLPGKTIEVTGTRLDGTSFQWNQLRGKVVLIDFWATWCGPCRAEFPNLAKLYEIYRQRGFEIVAICLDQERATLDEFIKSNSLPWINLHETQGVSSTADRYGISALPTSILVGKDGRVVSLSARGENLEKLLEKLLGPAGAIR
jgi:thiol-disulfide isomerase/thioredoxin